MGDETDGTRNGSHLATKKKNWLLVWSSDNPSLCALMEKNRLFVLRDFIAEEKVYVYIVFKSNLKCSLN